MNTCMHCGEKYERKTGPMICVCSPCLDLPSEPDPYVKVGSIYTPFPPLKDYAGNHIPTGLEQLQGEN